MRAWHFTSRKGYLSDGTPIVLGEPVPHIDGPIVTGKRGYHASPAVYDALEYAPGPHLYRVDLSGAIEPHGEPIDKSHVPDDYMYAASDSTAIAYIDATDLLFGFARQCALDVAHLWDAPEEWLHELRTGDPRMRFWLRQCSPHGRGAAYYASCAAIYSAADDPIFAARESATLAYRASGYARPMPWPRDHREMLAALVEEAMGDEIPTYPDVLPELRAGTATRKREAVDDEALPYDFEIRARVDVRPRGGAIE